MVRVQFVPERGDIVWINFSPRRGHEQKGKRPAFVLTVKNYNERSGLAIVCPVTSIKKGYPFEVEFMSRKIKGVILVDQMTSVDWAERRARFADRANADVIMEAQEKAAVLIGGIL